MVGRLLGACRECFAAYSVLVVIKIGMPALQHPVPCFWPCLFIESVCTVSASPAAPEGDPFSKWIRFHCVHVCSCVVCAQQMEQFPLFDVDAVEALMRSIDPGGYIIYRTTEKLVVASNKYACSPINAPCHISSDVAVRCSRFSPLCVSYKDESHEIMHNIVWINASAFGGWAP